MRRHLLQKAGNWYGRSLDYTVPIGGLTGGAYCWYNHGDIENGPRGFSRIFIGTATGGIAGIIWPITFPFMVRDITDEFLIED